MGVFQNHVIISLGGTMNLIIQAYILGIGTGILAGIAMTLCVVVEYVKREKL